MDYVFLYAAGGGIGFMIGWFLAKVTWGPAKPPCEHRWRKMEEQARLGGEVYDLYICQECGHEHWG